MDAGMVGWMEEGVEVRVEREQQLLSREAGIHFFLKVVIAWPVGPGGSLLSAPNLPESHREPAQAPTHRHLVSQELLRPGGSKSSSRSLLEQRAPPCAKSPEMARVPSPPQPQSLHP